MTRENWIKIATGLGIALAGAAITYVSTVVIPGLKESGDATLLIVAAVASALVNVARKYLEPHQTNG